MIWDFKYTDVVTGTGAGFDDPTEGAARQGALASAGDYLSGFLTSYSATIQMDVDGSETGDSTLAAAGSNYNGTAAPGFVERGDVMTKILGGADPAPGTADGSVTWNFEDFAWELGNSFQPGEFDFFSTAVHELVHALGFLSEILESGEDGYGTPPGDSNGNWGPFDEFLTDFAGTPIIDPVTFALDSNVWDPTKLSLDGDANPGCGAGTLFNGANAVAANGGQAAQIYAPSTWEGGSSGSHLDDNCYTNPGDVSTYMMESQTIDGLGVRTLSGLEIGMMRDIGYTDFGLAQGVPVPPVIYLIVSGLGLLGLSRRNRAA